MSNPSTPRILTPSPAAWDAFVRAQPRAHILQLADWGALKAEYGWAVERVAVGGEDGIAAGAQLLFRPLPLGVGTMAYLAMGPYPPIDDDDSIRAALWDAIHACARRRRAVLLKWEPGIFAPDDSSPNPAALGFRPAAQTIQPPRTILIDITGSDDAILARMNQGTRRKIRQSLKNGVTYREAAPPEIARFTAMMHSTGARNAFGVHEAAYYERAYALFVPETAALILAEHEGDALAGVMVFAVGRSAWYLYGASSDVKRGLMASYGAQWMAIQWAKARGCSSYDLWGIPDADEAALEAGFETRGDGLWGVYGFKRGWGGQIVRSLGAWDFVYNPTLYAGYQLALLLRG